MSIGPKQLILDEKIYWIMVLGHIVVCHIVLLGG